MNSNQMIFQNVYIYIIMIILAKIYEKRTEFHSFDMRFFIDFHQ